MIQIQPRQFRYFLTINNGSRQELVFSPEGWDSETIAQYKRDEVYRGLVRSMALPLKFVGDGKEICSTAFSEYGQEAIVLFECEQFFTEDWHYGLIFSSHRDFSTFEYEKDSVSVTLMESGVSKDIKAMEGTRFEYPLTGSDVVNVILPPVYFSESAQWIFLPNSGGNKRFFVGMDLIINDTNSGFTLPNNVQFQDDIEESDILGSGNQFLMGSAPTLNIQVSGRIKGYGNHPTLGTDAYFAVEIRDENGGIVQTIYSSAVISFGQTIPFEVTWDFPYTINANGKLYVYIRTVPGVSAVLVHVQEGEMNINYTALSPPSNCKAISALNLFKRIVAKIAPGYNSLSTLISTEWQYLMITSGNAIRELPDATIKCSFRDFFDTFAFLGDNAFGIDTEGALRIERASFFLDRTYESLDVGEVSDFQLSVDSSSVFSKLKIGYTDGNTEQPNGLEEYNSGQEWQMPITRNKQEKSWMSPFRADQFGIENQRVNFITKKTVDTSSDNETFMLDCYVSGANYELILGSSYVSVTGLSHPLTAYNLRLTPKRSLLNHQGYLLSMLHGLENEKITFASAVKNAKLTTIATIFDANEVRENEDILVSSLNDKYFMPYIAKINCKTPINSLTLMDNYAFGYISFTFNGYEWRGYVLDVSFDLARNTSREFTLLLTDSNNLLNLIK